MEKKSRHFTAVLYPDDPSHAAAVDLLETTDYEVAYILHDLDTEENGEYKKEHIHIVFSFPNPRSIKSVAESLEIPQYYIEPCFSVRASLRYLIHLDQPEKHQYEPAKVWGTASGISKFYKAINDNTVEPAEQAFSCISSYIYSSKNYVSFKEISQFAMDNGVFPEFSKRFYFYKTLLTEFNNQITKGENYDL